MRPAGGHPEQHVPRPRRPGQHRPALDRADREAGEIVVAGRVQPRHLRRLPADEAASRLPATLRDTLDDGLALGRVERAGSVVVEEEERLRALRQQVVDAHGDQIDPDAPVQTRFDGDAQLRAHPVRRRDQDRVREPGGLQVEQAAEAADPAHHAGPVGRAYGGLDRLDEGVARIDIDPRIAIGQPGSVLPLGHGARPPVLRGGLAHRGPFGKRRGIVAVIRQAMQAPPHARG